MSLSQTSGSMDDCLIAGSSLSIQVEPLLTVAIPHYKHRRYLEEVLQSIFAQDFDDFEIVVSDDCSPDDSVQVIPALLKQSGRPFRYYLQPKNLGYDGNVRFCLAAAQGRYVFLLGNDDALTVPDSFRRVAAALQMLSYPAVAFTSFADWSTGETVHRATETAALGSGPAVAIRFYRTFSFVSGLLFDREAANRHATERWDQSVFYQIYLACRIVAAGGALASLNVCALRKDVQVDGKPVFNYIDKASATGWSFEPRHTGLDSVIRVAADGVRPFLSPAGFSPALRHLIAQAYAIPYPYWLFEYRRVASWSYAVGVARGLWPRKLLAEYSGMLSLVDKGRLWMLYLVSTVAGLVLPVRLFRRLRAGLAHLIRRWQQGTRLGPTQNLPPISKN